MEKSFIFNSVNGDRRMKAEDFREYFNSFIGNGVFPNPATGLQVVAYDGMKLIVKEGSAFLKGAFYKNTEDLIVTLDAADGVLDRIDRVILRLDTLDRNIKCKIKKGIYASTPIAPTIQRDADGFELCIADIYISKGVVSILQSKITDTRLNSELCGIVTQTVNTIDTTELYRQLQEAIVEKGIDMDTWIREAKEYFSNWLQSTQNEFSSEFNTWFDSIKNILDESTAGTLLNMINANSTRIDDVEQQLSNIDTTAEKTTIVDTSNLFEATNVEDALKEVMLKVNKNSSELDGQRLRGISIANSLLSKV